MIRFFIPRKVDKDGITWKDSKNQLKDELGGFFIGEVNVWAVNDDNIFDGMYISASEVGDSPLDFDEVKRWTQKEKQDLVKSCCNLF